MPVTRHFTRRDVVISLALAITLLILGAALHHQAAALTQWLAENILPLAALPRSMGSYYPGFVQEGGFAFQLERLGILVSLTGIIWPIAAVTVRTTVFNIAQKLPQPPVYLLAATIFLVGFILYAYLAYPPYTSPANARIHWVDIYYSWSNVWVYALPKLINPLFHSTPHILPGIYGGISTCLFFLCLRQLKYSVTGATLGALSYAFASNLLIFATIAEDINLSMALLLFCAYTFLSQRWTLFGIATFLAFLARPTNLIFPVLLGASFYLSLYDYSLVRVLRSPFEAFRKEPGLKRAALVALLPAIFWNAYIIFIGQHYLFGVESTAIDNLSSQRSIKVDGFAIEQFSGTVILHQLWIFPIPVTLFAVAAFFVLRKTSNLHRSFFTAALITVIANIVLVEYLKMWYFNVRYITYFYPLFLLVAFGSLRAFTLKPATRITAFAFLSISTLTTYNYAFSAREKLMENPLSLAVTEHDQLIKTRSECVSYWTDHRSRGEKYSVSFLLKEDIRKLKVIADDTSIIPSTDCLLSAKEHPELKVIYSGKYVSVYKQPD